MADDSEFSLHFLLPEKKSTAFRAVNRYFSGGKAVLCASKSTAFQKLLLQMFDYQTVDNTLNWIVNYFYISALFLAIFFACFHTESQICFLLLVSGENICIPQLT